MLILQQRNEEKEPERAQQERYMEQVQPFKKETISGKGVPSIRFRAHRNMKCTGNIENIRTAYDTL